MLRVRLKRAEERALTPWVGSIISRASPINTPLQKKSIGPLMGGHWAVTVLRRVCQVAYPQWVGTGKHTSFATLQLVLEFYADSKNANLS
jgi:hypothetical protein